LEIILEIIFTLVGPVFLVSVKNIALIETVLSIREKVFLKILEAGIHDDRDHSLAGSQFPG